MVSSSLSPVRDTTDARPSDDRRRPRPARLPRPDRYHDRPSRSIAALSCVWLLSWPPRAGRSPTTRPRPKPPDADGIAFFEAKIRPVLVERCYQCHSAGSEKVKGGLRVDHREGMVKGGDGGPSVVPGKPEESPLIEAIRYGDESLRMPPKTPLTPEQVADFETWVRMGAPDPRDAAPSAAVAPAPKMDIEKARSFWSFRPVADPPVPAVKDPSWPRNEVDRFVLAGLEAAGLAPVPEADRPTLIRRATFDLTGLPPTPEEVDAFLADESPDAFEKVVERLLASPAYGERWGRHWLDLVRYADTAGCNSDFPVPTAYKYRDYVISAFNRDKPYDRFLKRAGRGRPAARRAAGDRARAEDRHRLPGHRPPVRVQPRRVPPDARRRDRQHRQGVPRPQRRLRPLPRPQVRPDPPGRLLRPLRHPRQLQVRLSRAGERPTGPRLRRPRLARGGRGAPQARDRGLLTSRSGSGSSTRRRSAPPKEGRTPEKIDAETRGSQRRG